MAVDNSIKKLRLDIGCINVNSMNVSTIGARNSKTYLKIEGVTSFKHDVIFICDLRLKDKESDIKRMFGLNRNCCYKIYSNSTNESRGVAIAIKSRVPHEIMEIFKTADNNIILVKIRINGVLCALGSIYGPNENNPQFFEGLKRKITSWNLPFVIGGDFNTILDQSPGEHNLDRIGGGRVPNSRNAAVINNWIAEGNCFEPFRSLYPEQKEISYIPFRINREGGGLYGKNRLDFFLISEDFIPLIRKVKYEERLSFDFDHKFVSLFIGKKKGGGNTMKIFNSTLENVLCKTVGILSMYDTINNHLITRFENLSVHLGNCMRNLQEYFDVEYATACSVNPDMGRERLAILSERIEAGLALLPDFNILLELEFTCDYKSLYEVVMNNLKFSLVDLQNRDKKLGLVAREKLIGKVRRMETTFGIESDQFLDAINALNRFDDRVLKDQANKYREFVLRNNEKPTKAFCLLGKENNLMDDLEQIQDANGEDFPDEKARKDYIKDFYGRLYMKKLDNLIRIEDFLGEELMRENWLLAKKLDNLERDVLDQPISFQELEKALKTCNLSSSTGWDGVSNVLIKKIFPFIGQILVLVAKNSFETGTLNNSFRLGQIKLIPKKGLPNKIEDWRPITLLCCGYKLISGVVAARLESTLDKIIGRSQKGFMGKKFMSTCTLNIMDRINGSWHGTTGNPWGCYVLIS